MKSIGKEDNITKMKSKINTGDLRAVSERKFARVKNGLSRFPKKVL